MAHAAKPQLRSKKPGRRQQCRSLMRQYNLAEQTQMRGNAAFMIRCVHTQRVGIERTRKISRAAQEAPAKESPANRVANSYERARSSSRSSFWQNEANLQLMMILAKRAQFPSTEVVILQTNANRESAA